MRIFQTAPRPTTYRVRRSAPANARFCGCIRNLDHTERLAFAIEHFDPAELATYSRPLRIDGEAIGAALTGRYQSV